MDISKARRLVELEKSGRKILVTLWEGEQITTCATAEEAKQHCETCQGGDELCSSYIDYLKGRGYQATEIELAEAVEETLPKFLEEREGSVTRVFPAVVKEVIEHAEVGTVEAVPGSPGELQPGESEGSSPEIS